MSLLSDPLVFLLFVIIALSVVYYYRSLIFGSRRLKPSEDQVGQQMRAPEVPSITDRISRQGVSCPYCRGEIKGDPYFCPSCGQRIVEGRGEEYLVSSQNLFDKVEELIHAGNIRRLTVKDELGNVLMDVPMEHRATDPFHSIGYGATRYRLLVLTQLSLIAPRFIIAVERTREQD